MNALINYPKLGSIDSYNLDPYDYDAQDNYHIAGPLTLDSGRKRAYIVPDVGLQLSQNEFDLLYLLAMREGIPLTFERLYASVWEQDDGVCRRKDARVDITEVVSQINAAGNGFAWIEYHPTFGYTFKTMWSHNRERWRRLPQ